MGGLKGVPMWDMEAIYIGDELYTFMGFLIGRSKGFRADAQSRKSVHGG